MASTRKDLKKQARELLLGQYGFFAGTHLLYFLVSLIVNQLLETVFSKLEDIDSVCLRALYHHSLPLCVSDRALSPVSESLQKTAFKERRHDIWVRS